MVLCDDEISRQPNILKKKSKQTVEIIKPKQYQNVNKPFRRSANENGRHFLMAVSHHFKLHLACSADWAIKNLGKKLK